GEVLLTGKARQQRVVPVPSVERGVRDEVVETGPEGDRGHEHGDGEHRAEDGGTDRDGDLAPPGLEGEAEAGHHRDWQSRVRRGTYDATFLLPGLPGPRGGESAQLPPG